MCQVCLGTGLVDEIDGHPVRFLRTILCPEQCDAATKSSAEVTDQDHEWRPIFENDPMHDLLIEGQRYIPLSKAPPLPRSRMSWFWK